MSFMPACLSTVVIFWLTASPAPVLSAPDEERPPDEVERGAQTRLEWNAIVTLRGVGFQLTTERIDDRLRVVEASILRDSNGFRKEHLAVLVDLPLLKKLCLNGDIFHDSHLRYLQDLTGLEELSIRGDITDDGLRYLRGLGKFKQLSLRTCLKITDKGLKHLTKLKKLEEIDLSDSQIGDDAFESLAKLPKLKRVSIGCTLISSYGFEKVKSCRCSERFT